MTDKKLWSGRFTGDTEAAVEAFTASIDYDKALYQYDIEGSVAHCRMLAERSIIPAEDAEAIVRGLETIRHEIEEGRFVYDNKLEDIHMHIESRLREIIGPAALKLHTARSRNDQIALDIRLYLRDESGRVIRLLNGLRKVFVDLAKQYPDAVMPGYTHLQRAQPVLLAHHFMAYYEMFTRDRERFTDGLKRIHVCPLGSAALAGTTYPIDRGRAAELLGFPGVSANSMDSVSDRDFIIEFMASASICMVHLSRLSEELILWSTSEFGFIEIPDSFATGSSIMPQKKNPDIPELIRGKTGRVFGGLITLLTIMKSLPLAYNRDMQEDKEPLFDTVKTLTASLDIMTRMLPGVRFNPDVMAKAAASGFLNATDLADYLVGKGEPFREAHRIAGKAVAYCIDRRKELHELRLAEFTNISPAIQQDVYEALTTEHMIDRRTSFGGTSRKTVSEAVKAAEQDLAKTDE